MNHLINPLILRAADAPAIKPAVELGTPLLLTIAAVGIAVLLVMIIRFKIQAFVALLTVSILVAVAAQIPLKDVFTVVANGVGGTMGKVALLIALGAVLGRMIEVSGGVQSLASHFTEKLGARRVAVALTAVGFLVAIPVFFEVGIIVLVPIVYAFAKIANVHPVKFGLPMAGIMLSIHVAVPPHPGIVAGAGVFGADIGLITLISLLICIPLGFLSYWVASIMNRKDYELLPSVKAQVEEFGSDSLVRVGHEGPGAHAIAPPRPALIIFLIAAPIVQILVGTLGTLTIPKDNGWYGLAAFIGNPFFALLVAVGLSFFLLAVRRNWSLKETGEIFEGALPPIASILMVVAAGGVFGEVLRTSGIGAALSQTLDNLGLPVIVLGFVISLALRAAQGSATVAIVTTTGLLTSAVMEGGYTPAQIAVIVIAIGFGALGLSHVTDAGFWTVVRYYGLTVSDGLRTWTVLTTVLGLAGFILTFGAWILVGGLGRLMRIRLDELVTSALQQGSAVPAFTCYDFTTALAVVAAAEDAGRGIVLLVAPKTAATANGLRLITALRSLADGASVPVAVQLDHASDLLVMADAVAAGADSILADGSHLPYEENIALVRAARALFTARPGAVVLEAELGGLAGDEDRAFGADEAGVAVAGFTDSAKVEDFVARTGAELLAVAVGNVHGKYKGEPQLRWDVLQDIGVRTHIPLVLHGASGIPAAELVKAAAMNVGKVNFNTELRTGVLSTLQEQIPAHRADGENLQGLLGHWNASAKDFATAALGMLTR